ncbi:MAG: hypothetical protein PQJ61_07180 [Spirochaetales bacterium]|uniref:DUF4595 domain-containing protein n=1 Tax=Candidatus Thalassospirochaeta sargassi TaxID=3119039 RepID=A0AAJ1MK77_9SPIO|nr:hypothetical protein [Spirochaetales bacterium]
MTNKVKLLPILILLTAFVFLSSCGDGTTDRLTAEEEEAYEKYIMSSYFMLRGDEEIAESRAAWDYTTEVLLPTDSTPVEAISRNYPEKGQSTTVKITKTDTDHVYKVVNVTTYPRRDSITSTTESYYSYDDEQDGYLVKDNGDGTFNTDPICTADGTINELARIEFTTLYDNGTERNETIEAVGGEAGTICYETFDLNDSLAFPDPDDDTTWGGGTFSNGEWSPGELETSDYRWSSMVTYNQSLEYDLWLWTYYQQILGVRYYTEEEIDGDTVRTSVTYERTVATTTDNEDLGDYLDWLIKFFSKKNSEETDADNTTYTETVIRTKIVGDKKKQIKTKSVVYDQAGQSVVNFTASYDSDDEDSGEPVAIY